MDSQSQVAVALALSLLGGLSTSFGALFVVINPAPNLKMLGLLQFFAGVLFFGVVANFIPEPTLAPISTDKSRKRYQIFMNIIASLKLEKWGWRRQRYHEKASAKFDSVELLPQYKFAQLSRGNGSVPWFN
nr:zinc transporter ZTP29-like isoform X2 [Arachis hypogaea]